MFSHAGPIVVTIIPLLLLMLLLFPYTTLFRSESARAEMGVSGELAAENGGVAASGEWRDVCDAASERCGGAGCENGRSEEHTSELQSRRDLVCRLLLEKKKKMRTMCCGCISEC